MTAARDTEATRAGYAEFFGRVSHDLRSPLGVISHFVEQFEAELGGGADEGRKDLVAMAGRGVRRLASFVDRMRTLSELEGDRLRLVTSQMDLGQVARAAAADVLAAEPAGRVEVAFEPERGSVVIVGDPRRLGLAIAELVSNALRHAHTQVRIGIEQQGDDVHLSVEDDGDGVTPAMRPTMFRRFVDGPRRAGMGVGLSIANDVVSAHGGRLAHEKGAPGARGARFVLRVPASRGGPP